MNGTIGGNYISRGYIGWNDSKKTIIININNDRLHLQEISSKVFLRQIWDNLQLLERVNSKLIYMFEDILHINDIEKYQLFHLFETMISFKECLKEKLNGISLIWSRLSNKKTVDWYKKPNRQTVWSRLSNKKTVDWYKKPNRDE